MTFVSRQDKTERGCNITETARILGCHKDELEHNGIEWKLTAEQHADLMRNYDDSETWFIRGRPDIKYKPLDIRVECKASSSPIIEAIFALCNIERRNDSIYVMYQNDLWIQTKFIPKCITSLIIPSKWTYKLSNNDKYIFVNMTEWFLQSTWYKKCSEITSDIRQTGRGKGSGTPFFVLDERLLHRYGHTAGTKITDYYDTPSDNGLDGFF